MAETTNEINEIETDETAVLAENLAEDAEAVSEAAVGSIERYISFLKTDAAYTELTMIAVAVFSAWLVGLGINRLIHKKFPALFESEWAWVTHPIKLLPWFFAIISLSFTGPMVIAMQVKEPHFIPIVMQIIVVWLLVKIVLMLVRSRVVAWLLSCLMISFVTLQAFNLLDPTAQLLSGIGFSMGDHEITLLGILQGIVLCVILFWLAHAGSQRVELQLRQSRMEYNIRELLIKFFKILFYTMAVLITFSTMGFDLTALAVFGGALGVGIGFGLQSITSNFISGIILLADKSIKESDLIEIDGVEGYVRKLNIRSTTIETFSGQEVTVPNETLLSNKLTNFTMSNRKARIEIYVGVAYGSDYGLVKELLIQAAQSHPRCMEDPRPGCYMREFADSSVNFRLQFWVADVVEGRLGPQSDVMFEIARLLDENNISIPFPQRDVNLIQAAA